MNDIKSTKSTKSNITEEFQDAVENNEFDRSFEVFKQFIQNCKTNEARNHLKLQDLMVELKNEIFECDSISNSEILEAIVDTFERINDGVF